MRPLLGSLFDSEEYAIQRIKNSPLRLERNPHAAPESATSQSETSERSASRGGSETQTSGIGESKP